MALTPTVFVDDPSCLAVAWVDETKKDGAIGQVDVTNRTVNRVLVVWGIYQDQYVESPPVAPGDTFTETFRGAATRAGDVSSVGYFV